MLAKIKQQAVDPNLVEVIVVDSGSTDRTLAIAAAAGCRILHLARKEFSFGRSLNIGCECAGGELLVFISGHCVPTNEHWLQSLSNPFASDDVAIAYGRQIGGEQTKFSEALLFEKYFPACAGSGQSPFFCNNANAVLRRTVWDRHRFDEALTGLEDMHLAKRLCSAGAGRVVYCPDAVVFHYHAERWSQVRRRYEREAIALQQIMPEVHVYWYDAFRYFFAGIAGDFVRASQKRCLWSNLGQIIAFRFCQFYGIWKGNHLHRRLSQREKDKYFYPH